MHIYPLLTLDNQNELHSNYIYQTQDNDTLKRLILKGVIGYSR